MDAQGLGGGGVGEEGEGAVAGAWEGGEVAGRRGGVFCFRGRGGRGEEGAEAGEEGCVSGFFGEEGGVEFLGFLKFAAEELEGFGSGCVGGEGGDGEVLVELACRF